jgi:hypothetical protein
VPPTHEAHILELLVLDELDDDVLVGLDLQHLQDQAEELGRLAHAAERAAHAAQLHGLVDDRLGIEAEALLLPVRRLVDLGADDLLDEVLRADG